MKIEKTGLAISPTPEFLCFAAACREHWDTLYPAGNKLIADVLEQWGGEERLSRGIVMVPDISNHRRVREALKILQKKNVQILWLAPQNSKEVIASCKGLKGVKLVAESGMRKAFSSAFENHTTLLKQLDAQNQDLIDFLRYKISLLLMRSFQSEPLEQAVSALVENNDGSFDLKNLSPADAQSVRNFRENDFPYFEGKSETIKNLKQRIIQVAPTDMGVLISGETGAGKEAIAFYIHEFSQRRSGPFITLNCAGLDETFLRSELFGHERGSFTGAITPKKGLVEMAEGGTLFLDELADMPLDVQADLLRFLQTKRYRSLGGLKVKKADIRIVAAAQPALFEKLSSGQFRQDLYYRISEIVLTAPSLRDVPDDIIRVIRHVAFSFEGMVESIDQVYAAIRYFEDGMDVIQGYGWPGNVRELAAIVKRKALLNDDVLSEIKARYQSGGLSAVDFSSALALHKADDIIPVDEMVRDYVRYVRASQNELPQHELSKRLGKSLNTIKKYL